MKEKVKSKPCQDCRVFLIHLLISVPAVAGRDELCRRKRPSTDTQIRGMGSIEPEICTKTFRNLSENSQQIFLQLHLATPR